MNRAQEKAQRLLQIEKLLWAHPEGLTRAEIARRLGLNRSTITKYLAHDQLPKSIYEDDLDGNKLKLDRNADLTKTSFSLHEVMAIHLATRLLATRTDKQNPHAASALRKLGVALARLDRNVSGHLLRSADVMDEDANFRDPVYLKVLETLTEAWSAGRKVRLSHQKGDGKISDYLFSPYFIEPYAVGQTAHAIGWREAADAGATLPPALRTLKIERIRAAAITHDRYEIPADFDPGVLLRDAWGIWYSDEAPVEVTLRFHPRVALRVRETRWHPSQQIEEQADGSLLWRARVAEVQEMVPWIRGWGADVEAVGPPELREVLEKEVRRLTALYNVAELPKPPLYQLLWAKAERKTGRMHPLICHMLDVGQVTQALWREVLTDSLRGQFANALGLDTEATGRLLAFWAALHDLGKASPAFQRQVKPLEARLAAAGLPFPKLFSQEFSPHGTISTLALEDALQSQTGLGPRPAKRIALALGGHHGAWPQPGATDRLKPDQVGGKEWDAVRLELVRTLRDVFDPPSLPVWIVNRTDENVFLTLFSGLTSVADWIGSVESYFPYVEPPLDPRRYAERAAGQARRALADLEWTGYQPPATVRRFEELFPFPPSPMQETVVELAEKLNGPALVLIEAPTGSGKTEAALYLADRWAQGEQQRGLYVAMPTMATSNQMHGRVAAVLRSRYGADVIEPLLVHSQARWLAETPPPEIVSDDERASASTRSMAWFLPRKRSLLAPFGVGTVDQSLISVLQTRHFFVRLFGLSHKTVIFDEVHAYDTYMSTLFEQLLGWLRAVGTSVVLLSATLPAQTRRDLVQAYAGNAVEVLAAAYPAITWAAGGQVGVTPLPKAENRAVALEWIRRDPVGIVARLQDALREGGCAAVICNTVARSQEVYRAVCDAKLVEEGDLILFHARTPFAWRDQTEREVLGRFGKGGKRPQKAVVVATQVIEQSLDLDFDMMISDLAPVDLLLQRAGRLHRHPRPYRPAPVAAARLLVAVDEAEEFPEFGSDAYVYESYVLLRSLLALQGRDRLILPQEEPSDLIEAVYGEKVPDGLSPSWAAKLAQTRQKMTRGDDKEVFEARKRLIRAPHDERLLVDSNADLEEDAPAVNETFQALTRLGDPSIDVVCLHAVGADLNTEPNGTGKAVKLEQKPDVELTGHLARHTVSLSQRSIFEYYLKQEVPSGWREHSLLNNHRVAIFVNGSCPLAGTPYTLRLSRDLGLEILKG
ncbi:MAG: CRISPR-associated helicase Cas3' [Chloroflexi bacterium]|nr:CRISPR-associated helicase Cas3' [Chloroflexota bacterium]